MTDDSPKPARKAKTYTHFKLVCISLYLEDLAALDAKVAELKQRGWVAASRSALIRAAVRRLDVEALLPREPGPTERTP